MNLKAQIETVENGKMRMIIELSSLTPAKIKRILKMCWNEARRLKRLA